MHGKLGFPGYLSYVYRVLIIKNKGYVKRIKINQKSKTRRKN